MNKKIQDHRAEVGALLDEGYKLWEGSDLPKLPQSEWFLVAERAAQAYSGEYSVQFAAACQCFYLFRSLHRMVEHYPAWATLLGDYFFSQFSKNLIPIDSVDLIEAFSSFLLYDTQSPASTDDFICFISRLPAVLKS